MRKIFLLTLVLISTLTPVYAKNVKVEALSDFSTANPPQTWQVKVVEGFVADNGFVVYPNSIIEGRIEDVTEPKRLKRNAKFVFVPINYYDAYNNETKEIQQDITAKYSGLTEVTPAKVVKTGAVAAGSHFISGFIGPGVALVEGAVKNDEGNRAKSAVVSVYESTPLSYANKGKELEISNGQVFIMNFKLNNEEQK